MLQVDLRELARGPVEMRADLAGTDPLFEGLEVTLAEPVQVAGRLQDAGDGRFYWRASLRSRMVGECRHRHGGEAAPALPDPDALEDPSSYPLARDALVIDLRPAVREELLLAVPRWVVCREDCRGLCPRCGKDLNAGACGCPAPVDPRWGGLTAVRHKLHD